MSPGPHRLAYEPVQHWAHLPEGLALVDVAGVAVDSRDRIYVLNRGRHPILMFDRSGQFLGPWGDAKFRRPHGIFITPQDQIFLVDDEGHTVHRCDAAGRIELTLGTGHPADTGYVPGRSPLRRAAGPFNTVTNVAVGPAGEVYAADGYGNARVHKFSPDGKLLLSWGEPGAGEGQFNLPHGIAVDSQGLVYVADRENSRIQIFTSEGAFVRSWNWVNRPCEVFIDDHDSVYIAELGFLIGNPPVPHLRLMREAPPGHSRVARVSVCNREGEVLAQICGDEPIGPGGFIAPHDLWVDSHGDLYVGEVVTAVGAVKALAPVVPPALRKFVCRPTG